MLNKITNVESSTEALPFAKLAVISCFSEHHSYFTLATKGKKLAFQKGWEAKEKGMDSKDCPYEPRIKNQLPTNSYYKHWHLGYECCQNSL